MAFADAVAEADPLWDKFPQLQSKAKFTRFGATQRPEGRKVKDKNFKKLVEAVLTVT